MPDLDHELAGLRDRLHDDLYQPSVEAVTERARQRTSRRRRQFGAAAAVLLVGAAIPLLRAQTAPVPVPDPPLAPPTAGTLPGFEALPPGPFVVSVDFSDERNGYALRAPCTDAQDRNCVTELFATGDGERWEKRTMPIRAREMNQQLNVVGPRSLYIDTVLGTRSFDRWFSADGGRTWREVSVEPELSVAAIPEGAVLHHRCTPDDGCVPDEQFFVLLPDGRTATLATQPPLTQPFPGRIQAADGGWWVSGRNPATGRWALAVSRDDGRTWSVSDLPEFAGTPLTGFTVTAGPNALYASAVGTVREDGAEPRTGILAFLNSVDGGATWTLLHDSPVDQLAGAWGGMVATADGRLILNDDFSGGEAYVSSDNGKTFTKFENREFFGPVWWTRGGYVSAFHADGTALRSTDGQNWQALAIG